MAIDVQSQYDTLLYYANLLITQYQNGNGTFAITDVAIQMIMPQNSTHVYTFSSPISSISSGVLYVDYLYLRPGGSFEAIFSAINILSDATSLAAQFVSQGYSTMMAANIVAGANTVTINFPAFAGLPPVAIIPLPTVNQEDSHLPLLAGVTPVTFEFSEPAATSMIPLAIQNAYNLIGDNIAVGDQLDTLAKYIGVKRTYGTVTLTDAQLLVIMKLKIVQNSSDASLASIVNNLQMFFPNQIYPTDEANMQMSYELALTDQTLIDAIIGENLLPRPLGVGVAPPITFNPLYFGARTYALDNTSFNTGLKTYNNYNSTYKGLTYANVIV